MSTYFVPLLVLVFALFTFLPAASEIFAMMQNMLGSHAFRAAAFEY